MTVSNPNTIYFDWETYQDGRWMDFDKTTKPCMKELLECFVGIKIGEGTSRTVFECRHDPALVVKIGKHFDPQNAVELSLWEEYKDTSVAKWLAPVTARSSSLRVIVQKRTLPLLRPPKKIPSFLCDLKVQNFGMLDGQLVAHDYGTGFVVDPSKKIELVEPTWWDGATRIDL